MIRIAICDDEKAFRDAAEHIRKQYEAGNSDRELKNLRKMKELPVELALPAHRQQGEVSLAERADTLISHHERRLAEMERRKQKIRIMMEV